MASDEPILGPTWQEVNATTTNSLRFTGTINPTDSGVTVEIVIEDTTTGDEYIIGNGTTNASGGFSITTSCSYTGSYWIYARIGDSYSADRAFLINVS